MQRYKAVIEYDGAGFCGWQRQADLDSVQSALESALSKAARRPVEVFASGRTDAGVHALGQVAHFDIASEQDEYKLRESINFFLRPNKIVVKSLSKVECDFHARFSAKSRSYIYRIINRQSPLVLDAGKAWLIKRDLDIDAMKEAANHLIGIHDFSSFRASICQAASPVKTLDKINIVKKEEEISLYFSARSFLHHMVRNIVGTLADVGSGKIAPCSIKYILEARKRSSAGQTAPACGLYFLEAQY